MKSVERVFGYGVNSDAGSYTCIDCGQRYDHEVRSPLPPCPHYSDETHPRAGWFDEDRRSDRDAVAEASGR